MATCARGRRDRRAPRLWLDQRRVVDLREWRGFLDDARGAAAADYGGALCPGSTLNRPTLCPHQLFCKELKCWSNRICPLTDAAKRRSSSTARRSVPKPPC